MSGSKTPMSRDESKKFNHVAIYGIYGMWLPGVEKERGGKRERMGNL